ncbi:hypothetical protein HFO56_33415 [Rhizobium laguerreae]|uniref:hypothetical protein n=1 Tax=Rhizobium laguerreae TaxID=1076926 RepID=UPI001C8FC739|nr:hypothetical protein [Rhizobium laguerreae]MBY3157226.1 hypothetical protein [Rhizobium laguerreae]MBY3432923.1 hypothetical protein [Rhizobium laguerreae]
MARYSRGSLMDILVHSAVAGAGLSFGRDVYRKTRDNFLLIVVAVVALAGTAYGFWNMSRGHDRGAFGTFFLTFLANAVLVVVSFGVFMMVMIVIGSSQTEPNMPPNMKPILIGLGLQAALAIFGIVYGLKQRPKRKFAFLVDKENEAFLDRNGFRGVGGNEDVMLDPSGNELVLEDFRLDAVVFKVKGRRGVRAKILLDDHGRMTSYVPA